MHKEEVSGRGPEVEIRRRVYVSLVPVKIICLSLFQVPMRATLSSKDYNYMDS